MHDQKREISWHLWRNYLVCNEVSVVCLERSFSFQYPSGNMEDYGCMVALLPNKADKYYCKMLHCQILRQWQLRSRVLYSLKNALGKCSTHSLISIRIRMSWSLCCSHTVTPLHFILHCKKDYTCKCFQYAVLNAYIVVNEEE